MTRIRRTSLHDPAATRRFSRGEGALARVGPLVIGRATLLPGWRWSADIKPSVGTASCELHHLHVLIAGRFAVEMDDGERAEFEPGDVFDLPPGHDAWVVGDEPVDLLDVSGNVAEFGLPTSHAQVVATMLMTDIVGSTATAARLGDVAWRQKLSDHNRVVRSQIDRFRGREIDTTGDGFLVVFDSAVAALRCAQAIRSGLREIDLEARIGIHTGEIRLSQGDVQGIAVHATARVMAAAGPSEILVSALTHALAQGSELTFVPLGERRLKGLPSPMELFALD